MTDSYLCGLAEAGEERLKVGISSFNFPRRTPGFGARAGPRAVAARCPGWMTSRRWTGFFSPMRTVSSCNVYSKFGSRG